MSLIPNKNKKKKKKKKNQENCVTCEERIDRKVTNYPKVLVVGLSFLFHEKGNVQFQQTMFLNTVEYNLVSIIYHRNSHFWAEGKDIKVTGERKEGFFFFFVVVVW